MLARRLVRAGAAGLALAIIGATAVDVATAESSVYQATLAEANQKSLEVSTEEVRRILADGSAILLDFSQALRIRGRPHCRRKERRSRTRLAAGCLCRRGRASAATRLSRWCSIAMANIAKRAVSSASNWSMPVSPMCGATSSAFQCGAHLMGRSRSNSKAFSGSTRLIRPHGSSMHGLP